MMCKHIYQLFEEQVVQTPDAKAVVHGDEFITYQALNQKVNQLANFLIARDLPDESIIAFVIDNSINTLVSLLGILKAGHAFLSLDPILLHERLKHMIKDSGSVVLLTQQRYLNRATKLQWDCPDLHTVVSLDSALDEMLIQGENQLMNPELWDYIGSNAQDQITCGGWVSSYTGDPFSKEEMDEYGDNVMKKVMPYIKPASKVLEIGCSSGITLLKIAPHVKEYLGIDISEEILKFTQKEVENAGLDNVRLETLGAHQLSEINDKEFDIVIINSVVQSFEGHSYFHKVLKDIIEILKDKAIIFFGDIQNQDQKDQLIESLRACKNQNPSNHKIKTDWSQELFLSKDFFSDLAHDYASIADVVNSPKIGTISNELTDFRYDVIIKVDKAEEPGKLQPSERKKKCFGSSEVINTSDKNPELTLDNEGLAYILYTSGSTGRPKGVEVLRKNLYNYVHWAGNYYFDSETEGNMGLVTSISFDLTLTCLFVPLSRGNYVYVPKGDHFSEALEDCLSNPKVDTLKLTPTHLSFIQTENVLGLKKVILGGEQVKSSHIKKIKSLNPDITIYNEYGPTEATVGCSVAEVDHTYLGIGRPISNTAIFILDHTEQVVPINNAGEICIGGDGVARGYRNEPVLTKSKFVSNPYGEGILYKTGDFGKWSDNGTIELIGRKDKQVKIRGLRIETGEIEKVLLGYPGILNCIVKPAENKVGEQYLVAYFVAKELDSAPSDSDLIAYLRNYLPAQSMPEYFMAMGKIPLLSNGKLDEKSLPDPSRKVVGQIEDEPIGDLEIQVANIWKHILGRDSIGREDNFFSLNGHSLKAMQVISHIEKELDVKIKLKTIFTYPTIKGLSEQISKEVKEKFEHIPLIDKKEYYEVSHAQKRVWLADKLEGFSRDFPYTKYFFRGALDISILKKAVMAVVERHEVLRTLFYVKDGELKQVVKGASEVNFKIDDTEIKEGADLAQVLEQLEIQDSLMPFNLEVGPLMKMRIVKAGQDKFMVLFATHHIISDGASMQIFINEVKTLYEAFMKKQDNPLKPLRIHYKDYSDWHNRKLKGEAFNVYKDYWKQKLSGEIPSLFLQAGTSSEIDKEFLGQIHYDSLSKDSTYGIIKICEKLNATIFIALQTCIKILLYRNTGFEDIILGSPISGRVHTDLDNQIGLFLNILPLRNSIDKNDTFEKTLNSVKDTTLEAYSHQLYPFDLIIEDSKTKRLSSQNMIFDVGFTYHNHYEDDDMSDSLSNDEELLNTQDDVQSSYHLWFLAMRHSTGIKFMVKYNSEIFDQSKLEKLMKELKQIIENVCGNYLVPIGEIALHDDVVQKENKVDIKLEL